MSDFPVQQNRTTITPQQAPQAQQQSRGSGIASILGGLLSALSFIPGWQVLAPIGAGLGVVDAAFTGGDVGAAGAQLGSSIAKQNPTTDPTKKPDDIQNVTTKEPPKTDPSKANPDPNTKPSGKLQNIDTPEPIVPQSKSGETKSTDPPKVTFDPGLPLSSNNYDYSGLWAAINSMGAEV